MGRMHDELECSGERRQEVVVRERTFSVFYECIQQTTFCLGQSQSTEW